jgi:trimeric autotransporter adhesin
MTPKDGKRDLPDVSFLAGNGLYGAVWLICGSGSVFFGPDCQMFNGEFTSKTTFTGAGGTSAATPAFAGMLTLVVQATGSRLGQANNVLYQLAASKYGAVFNDVTTGNNGVVCTSGSPDCGSNGFTTGYDAATGYDQASGLGSVNAAAMLANWSSAAANATATTMQIDGAVAPVSVTHGTSLNFTVGVTPATASGSAALITTQTVAAGSPTNNGQISVPLTSGAGSLSYNGLPGGAYTVYARYSGDTTDASSSSVPISVNIATESSSTLLAVNAYGPAGGNAPLSNLGALPYGSYIFGDATVYGTAEGLNASLGLATGTFTILDGGKTLGTAPMNSANFASFPSMAAGVYPFAVGTHKMTATYPGDASYTANTSNEVDFTVIKGVTTTTVLPASASFASAATDQVQVQIATSSLALAPSGTVTLTANGTTLGSSSNLVNGVMFDGTVFSYVTFPVQGSQLAAGANTLSATYAGDNNYLASTGTGNVTVVEAGFSLKAGAIAISAGSATGNTSTISATPSNGFAGVINLSCSVTASPANASSPITCSVPSTVNITGTGAATATLTVSSTASTSGGDYTVTIAGTDAATGHITSSTTTQVTVTGAAGIALTNSGAISFVAGATSGNVSTITVTPSGGFTGAVALSCAVTSAPAAAVDPVTCALQPSSVSISGTPAVTSLLTVSSTARTSAALDHQSPLFLGGVSGTFVALCLFFVPVRRRRQLRGVAMLGILISLGSLMGCGGGSGGGGGSSPPPSGTTAGVYVITVTSSAAGLSAQSTTVNVTVN